MRTMRREAHTSAVYALGINRMEDIRRIFTLQADE